MNTKHKLFGALAVAGIVAASGSAFTGAGLTNNAAASQFVGGSVSQSVTGATLDSIHYVTDTSGTSVTAVNLVFADGSADSKTVTATADNATPVPCTIDVDGQADPITGHFTCSFGAGTAIVSTLHVTVASDAQVN